MPRWYSCPCFSSKPSHDFSASFSADGKWIVFTSERNGSADIYRVHTDGTALERLTNDFSFDDQAAFSPDGKNIAFVSSRKGQTNIFTLDIATRHLTNVTNRPAGDCRPSWSPDGKWIAFSSGRTGFKDESALHPYNPQPYGEISVMHADSSDVRVLTNNQFEEATPT